MFVTDKYELVLTTMHDDGVLLVYCKDDARVATITSEGKVVLGDDNGMYDGTGCVLWEDGTTWNRVDMSYSQYRILSYRPFVPITLLFLRFLQNVMLAVKDRIVAVCCVSSAPTSHVE